MFSNLFTGSLRFFNNHKNFSVLNLLSLSTGTATCLFILGYINFQLNFDSFNTNKNRLYRIELKNGVGISPSLFPSLPTSLLSFSGVNSTTAIKRGWGAISTETTLAYDERIYWADNNFLSLFSYKIIDGSYESLKEPFTAVITKSVAVKHFGNDSPLNHQITFTNSYNKKQNYIVKAVIEDIPENSHLTFDVLLSFVSLEEAQGGYSYGWSWKGVHGYALIEDAVLPSQIEKAANDFLDQLRKKGNSSISINEQLSFVKLTDVHNDSISEDDWEKYGSMPVIYFLIGLGLILFTVSIFNFLNLITVSSSYRIKEIGIKKVLGAKSVYIFCRFAIESGILLVASFIIGISVYALLWDRMNEIVPLANPFMMLFNLQTILILALIFLEAISKIPFADFLRLWPFCIVGFFAQTTSSMRCKSRLA